nr:MAG TPA: hypothetical protein [Caudoviricetes sp.]
MGRSMCLPSTVAPLCIIRRIICITRLSDTKNSSSLSFLMVSSKRKRRISVQ